MSGRHAEPSPRRGGPISRIGDLLLTVASVGGAVCILVVIAALLLDISMMLFKTGSMSPTIPAGSMAVVREIPASEVVVGDVVTVDRAGQLPVTHRAIAVAPAADGRTQLTLQGDANPVPDAEPYVVERVRIVLWSIPGVASIFIFLAQPWVMLSLAVLVAGLVTWAFWPRADPGTSESVAPEAVTQDDTRVGSGT